MSTKELVVIFHLAKRDFLQSYLGTALGFLWTIIGPAVYILVLWFFLTKGAKFRPTNNAPFVPWLMCSMSIWYFFSKAIGRANTTFMEYSFFLRHPNFPFALLPFAKIISAFFFHLIFLAIFIVLLLTTTSFTITAFWIQSLYFIFCTFALLFALCLLVTTLNLFLKDVKHLVEVTLQILFWGSPIFWDNSTFSEQYQFFLKLNPLNYIMTGYRYSFMGNTLFWSNASETLIFWAEIAILTIFTLLLYKKLKPHFGDVIKQ